MLLGGMKQREKNIKIGRPTRAISTKAKAGLIGLHWSEEKIHSIENFYPLKVFRLKCKLCILDKETQKIGIEKNTRNILVGHLLQQHFIKIKIGLVFQHL